MILEELLNSKQIPYKSAGKDILVCCFNPEHDDSSPSMRIDRVSGVYHCFSCGHKGSLFADFNMYRNIFTNRVSSLLESVRELRYVNEAYPLPLDAYRVNKPFRGISAETISRFGAFTSSQEEWEGRLVFPLMDASGTIKALIGRYINTSITPKYMVKPDSVKMPLFPPAIEVTPLHRSIILVEGIIDALNLIDKGLGNTVCCFGTNQLEKSVIKEKLMPYRIAGVEKIYLMLDGDAAGQKAALKIKDLILHNTDFMVEILTISENSDPGDMTQSEVDNIKNYLQNN